MFDEGNVDDARHLVVVPDTNILVHGRALGELPWKDLSTDAIEVRLIVPVIDELDKLKTRPGRVGRLSRNMSSKLRPLFEGRDNHLVIRDAGPQVTLSVWLDRPGEEAAAREGMDLKRLDQAIISRLAHMADSGENVLFITHDGMATAFARRFSVPVLMAPEEWMRAPEQDEVEKENANLKAANTKLASQEPVFEGWFEDGRGEKITKLEAAIECYGPLTHEDASAFAERVIAASKQVDFANLAPLIDEIPFSERGTGAGLGPQIYHVPQREIERYQQDYAKWETKLRETFRTLHNRLNSMLKLPTAKFMARNVGTRPAANALVELTVDGRLLIGGPNSLDGIYRRRSKVPLKQGAFLLMPPVPPRPVSNFYFGLSRQDRDPLDLPTPFSLRQPTLNDPEKFYYVSGKSAPAEVMSLECESWRHQRSAEDFPFILVTKLEKGAVKGMATAAVSAANLSTPFSTRLPISISVGRGDTGAIAERWASDAVKLLEQFPLGPWPKFSDSD